MRILLSNDDGYTAEGLLVLAEALADDGHEVHVSAPVSERSGAGHGLTFGRKLAFRDVPCGEIDFPHGRRENGMIFRAVWGSPADCVKFALEHLYKGEKFDLVISGINSVPNVGSDIIYSGTFGAAEEGTILGVPSIAVSAAAHKGGYGFAADFVRRNLAALRSAITPLVTLNVNVPPRGEIKGVAAVPLGIRRYNDWYEPHEDAFRLTGYPYDCSSHEETTDCKMYDCGYITVTPVKIPDTDEGCIKVLGREKWTL